MAIFTNQATLSYRNGAVNSNVVTGEIVDTLSVTKHALLNTYSVGDTVTYVIVIYNSGENSITSLSLTDNLGAYLFGESEIVPLTYIEGSVAYYLNGTLQPQPDVVSGSSLTVNNLTVPAGGYAYIVYEARVNEFAPVNTGGQITNTVTVVSGSASSTDQETITALSAPVLGIIKAVSPATVSENGSLTYTFTIQNFGNSDAVATDDLVVSDTFSPVLDITSVTYNGLSWSEGAEYNYNVGTGDFTTVPGNITVPAATYTQNPETGEWNVVPGEVTLTVTGTV